MSTVGIFNTSNYARHELPESLLSTIHRKAPRGLAPFSGMLARVPSKTITSTAVRWFGSRWSLPSLRFTSPLTAALRGRVDQVQVENADFLIEKQVYQIISTQEQVLVLSVVGNVVAIRRGVGDIPGVAVAAGAEAMQVGTAFEESSICPMPRHTTTESAMNITQIFRNSWGVSGTVDAITPAVGEKRGSANKKEMLMDHAIEIEQAFLFGQMFETVQNGQPLRKMDGILAMIRKYAPQNIKVAGQTTTWDQLEAMTDSWFDVVTDQSSDNDRVLFVDKIARKVINDIGRNYYNVTAQPSQTSFGMEFTTFRTSRGTFQIVEHPLFNLMHLNGFAAAIDLSPITRHYLPGRNGAVTDTMSDNCIDAVGGTVLTEMTLSNEAIESSGFITGLCQAAVAPVQTPVTVNMACLTIDHPCVAGKLEVGSAVILTITKAAPSTNYVISGPAGDINVTTNAQGTVSTSAIVLSEAGTQYTWSIKDSDAETLWISSVVQACTKSPCEDSSVGINDSQAVDNPLAASGAAGSNTTAWDGVTQPGVPQTNPDNT